MSSSRRTFRMRASNPPGLPFVQRRCPKCRVSKRATHIRLADIPTALLKAAKKGKLDEMRVAFANWVVTTFPGAAVTHADIIRQLCGDTFYDALPKDWLAKKFLPFTSQRLASLKRKASSRYSM